MDYEKRLDELETQLQQTEESLEELQKLGQSIDRRVSWLPVIEAIGFWVAAIIFAICISVIGIFALI